MMANFLQKNKDLLSLKKKGLFVRLIFFNSPPKERASL
ncbi:hypothetical protein FTV88_0455 [Heliorestis convoluta]|uniref:Uncharacterized protein n=1 Tax=Heliorestis convoluta TaxID=356322 RepID=A0A5Q2MW63_9FIRM|nr:hypothetical protein FTV88_0455 [Heliorestis convoluta]